MSFSADWLALRAPADAAARDAGLLAAVAGWAAGRPGLTVVDLGAGSGATLRVLYRVLPDARWRLIDADAALLALAATSAAALGARAETRVCDLATDLARALDPAPDLVAASAFFDLAGRAWIETFADAASAAGAAVYAALSYDGRESWLPPDAEDAAVHAAFLRDMGRDKGLGPAEGHRAAATLAGALRARGYAVTLAASDWRLRAPHDAALIAALADGHADAGAASAHWRAARRRATAATIGHQDLWATPPARA